MNATDLIFFKNYLLSQKSSILNKTLEFRNENLTAAPEVSDDAEAASRDLNMSLSIYLHERDRNSLMQIERALGKLAEGAYGRCELCEEPIEIRRLKARPLATLCIHCMEEHEVNRDTHH